MIQFELLLFSKSVLRKDETSEVERLYRIYSGCLEYLVYLLHRMRSLLAIFRINHGMPLLAARTYRRRSL